MKLGRVALVALVVTGLGACSRPTTSADRPSSPPTVVAPPGTAAPVGSLFFDSDRTGNFELFRMDASGGNVSQITRNPAFDSWWPRLAPDRTRVVFYRTPKGVHDRDYTQATLWSANADGTEVRELRTRGADGWQLQGHAEWSPDGQQLVMFGGARMNPQIFVTDSEGRSPRAVTSRGGQNLDPSWSPDSRTIVFVGCPVAVCFERDYEIFTIGASGGTVRRMTTNSIRDHDPYFSPDGTHVAWLAQTDLSGPVGVWNIFLMRSDGSGQRNLTNDGSINSRPEWSRDGTLIFFHRVTVGRSRFSIFSIQPDGSGLTEITVDAPGNNEYPSN